MKIENLIGSLPFHLQEYIKEKALQYLFTTSELISLLVCKPHCVKFTLHDLDVTFQGPTQRIIFGDCNVNDEDYIIQLHLSEARLQILDKLLSDGVITIQNLKVNRIDSVSTIFIKYSKNVQFRLIGKCSKIDPAIGRKINEVIYGIEEQRYDFNSEFHPLKVFPIQKHHIHITLSSIIDVQKAQRAVEQLILFNVQIEYKFAFYFGFAISQPTTDIGFESYITVLETFLLNLGVQTYVIETHLNICISDTLNLAVQQALSNLVLRIGLQNITNITITSTMNDLSVVFDAKWISKCLNLQKLRISKSIRCSYQTIGDLQGCTSLTHLDIDSNNICFNWLSSYLPQKEHVLQIKTDLSKAIGVLKVSPRLTSLVLTDSQFQNSVELNSLDFGNAQNFRILKIKGSPYGDRQLHGFKCIPPSFKFLIVSSQGLIQLKHDVCVEPDLWDDLKGVYVNNTVCWGFGVKKK